VGDRLKEFQFRNFKVKHPGSTFPNMETQVNDDLFEGMECFESLCDAVQNIGVDVVELREISYIEEGANADDELWVSDICDYSKDVPLDISVFTTGHLFQGRNPRGEVANPLRGWRREKRRSNSTVPTARTTHVAS
jgi:hypothetical protein